MSENEQLYDPSHTPLGIADAASMLRREIVPNMPPYSKDTVKYNNNLVDEWHKEVLTKICTKTGKIPSGSMWFEWQYFYTGKTIKQFMSHLDSGAICRPSKEAIEYWVNTFSKKSVKELVKIGAVAINHGWKLIIDETLIRTNEEKWNKIYSLTDDPLEWRKLGNDNPRLWNMDQESPFWPQKELEDVVQKVMTIIKTPITPTQ